MSGSWTDRIASIAGFLGITAVLAALGFLLIELRITGTSGFLFIWGAALILVWVILTPQPVMEMLRGRGLRFGTLNLLTSALFLGIVVVLNVFVSKHPEAKADLTRLQVHTLNDQTKRLLQQVTSPMLVTVFITAGSQQAGTNGELPIADLLAEYQGVQPNIHVRYVDPNQYPALRQQYGAATVPSIYFDYKNRPPQSTTGTTEADIDSGILKAVQGQPKSLCFINDHGEPGIAPSGGSGASPGDYSQLATYLQQQNFTLTGVSLTAPVPSTCNSLVEFAPQHPLGDAEIASASAYLSSGGHLLLLTQAFQTQNLNSLLAPYGVSLDGGLLFDFQSPIGPDPTVVRLSAQPGHAITKDLVNFAFAGIQATGITVDASKAGSYTQTALASTDPGAYEASAQRTDYSSAQSGDKKGPFTVAEAVAANTAVKGQHTRIVVIGTAQFVTDQIVAQLPGNASLLVSSLNWVVEREVNVAIPATTQQTDTLQSINTGDQRKMFILLSLVLPGVILLTGLSVYLNRR